ncbi:MAG: transposase [Pseudomonadales bacterium]|nr:transposase [Pseudomonadales bacterium]
MKLVINSMLSQTEGVWDQVDPQGNHKGLASEIGMSMVLHTHTRQLDYHPHIHIVVV